MSDIKSNLKSENKPDPIFDSDTGNIITLTNEEETLNIPIEQC